MSRDLVIRVTALYLPIVIAGALWCVRRLRDTSWGDARHIAGLLLACAWNAPALLLVHLIAARLQWWSFQTSEVQLLGFPVELYVGWIVLWGAVPALAFPRAPFSVVAACMFALDLLLMPLCEPVLTLGAGGSHASPLHAWLTGEIVAIAIALVPAQCLARWTIEGRRLSGRALLQALAFVGLLLGVIPSILLAQTGADWTPVFERSARVNNLLAQLLVLAALPGLSAVQEFVERGRGTPLPYDPPRQLVTTGPYAYIANPMQSSTVLVLLVWSVVIHNLWFVAASLVALAYGMGLAAWHEDEQLSERFGSSWTMYRRHVARWWPRWRPFIGTPGAKEQPARLYVAQSCPTCQGVGRWLAERGVSQLEIVAAEDHPTRHLSRLTYEVSGQPPREGIAAFARALEHIHFAWALAGMFMRLPVVRPFLQLLVDASGGGPMLVTRHQAASTKRPSQKTS